VLFPGNSGIIAARSDLLAPWTYRAPLVLTELHTADGRDPAGLTQLAQRTGLTLPASGRGFDAEFALLDYTGPESVRYYYRLANFDPKWSETTADRRVVKYTNLPPGEYQLLLRAASRSGAGPEATIAIPVIALPAWHETSWFMAARSAFVVACVLAAIWIRTAFLRRRQRELQREVAERTAELEEKRAELQEANQRLSFLATRDPLTGILNRRHFLELAEIEMARSRRSRRQFSIFLADIDHFKRINDTYGHTVGDAVIRAVAGRFSQTLRATDILARYGGEEMVGLLPETDESAAVALAERLRREIEGRPVVCEQAEVQVTVSIGMAQSVGEESIDATLERADKALYAAKHGGRNRVAVEPREFEGTLS
jgi:diguanylate cyclase (GGDEF)-like protein